MFGIASIESVNKQNKLPYDMEPEPKYYLYGEQGEKVTQEGNDWLAYGEEYNDGDVIKMEVNTLKETLQFYKNGKELGDIHIDFGEDTKYKLMVCMRGKDDAIVLTAFTNEMLGEK